MLLQQLKLPAKKHLEAKAGFGIIEIIVAMGIFVILAVSGAVTVVGSFSTNRLGDEETQANIYAQEGIEAVRSIKNQGWSDPFLATDCSSGCGVDASGGNWIFSGSSDTIDGFTRVVTVNQAQRNGSNDIVMSGGTADSDTYQVESTVTWNFTPTRSNTVSLVTYLTNFRKAIGGDWSNITQSGSLNLSGNDNGLKVQIAGNYAYVVRNNSSEFVVVDISTLASPSEVTTLSLSGSLSNIFVAGDYAYVTSNSNSAELQIIDISNPASPSQVGAYNDSGNNDPNGVYVVGNTTYMAFSGNDEFVVVNTTVPASPAGLGSLNLSGSSEEVVVSGNYAYVSSSNNSQELKVIDVSLPTSPNQVATLNLPSNTNATALAIDGNILYLAQGDDLRIISIATPTSPSLLGSYDADDGINDIALNFADSGATVFLATDDNSSEFQVLDVSNLASPTLLTSINVASNSDLLGIAYDETLDAVVAVGANNSNEVLTFGPQ